MTSTASAAKLGYVGSVPGTKRDSDSWFTPKPFVDSARKVLRGITLDPFSSEVANAVVEAEHFFTHKDNAFEQDWCVKTSKRLRTVWMNPPYSGKLCREAVNRFIDEYEDGSFHEGIFLVNNSTETAWFQRALQACSAVCFPKKRISFWNADGKAVSGNTRGQAFFYFGNDIERFANEFGEYGTIMSPKF